MEQYLFRDQQTGELLGVFPSKTAAHQSAKGGYVTGDVVLFRVRTGEDAATGDLSLQQVSASFAA